MLEVLFANIFSCSVLHLFIFLFSSISFTVSSLIFRSLINYELIFVHVDKYQPSFIFLHVFPIFPEPFMEKTFFSPLYIFSSFVKNYLPTYMWVYFWALNSLPLICVSVFLPILCCFDYCHFVVQCEVRGVIPLALFFLSQDCFGYLRSFVVPYKSDDFCPIF